MARDSYAVLPPAAATAPFNKAASRKAPPTAATGTRPHPIRAMRCPSFGCHARSMFVLALPLRSIVLHPNIPVPPISRLLVRLHVARSRMYRRALGSQELMRHTHVRLSHLHHTYGSADPISGSWASARARIASQAASHEAVASGYDSCVLLLRLLQFTFAGLRRAFQRFMAFTKWSAMHSGLVELDRSMLIFQRTTERLGEACVGCPRSARDRRSACPCVEPVK